MPCTQTQRHQPPQQTLRPTCSELCAALGHGVGWRQNCVGWLQNGVGWRQHGVGWRRTVFSAESDGPPLQPAELSAAETRPKAGSAARTPAHPTSSSAGRSLRRQLQHRRERHQSSAERQRQRKERRCALSLTLQHHDQRHQSVAERQRKNKERRCLSPSPWRFPPPPSPPISSAGTVTRPAVGGPLRRPRCGVPAAPPAAASLGSSSTSSTIPPPSPSTRPRCTPTEMTRRWIRQG